MHLSVAFLCLEVPAFTLTGASVPWRTADAAVAVQTTADVEIENTSWTSRKVYARISVRAPVEVVWGCLSDYDNLGTFIPSLVENVCLERKPNGAVLKQVFS